MDNFEFDPRANYDEFVEKLKLAPADMKCESKHIDERLAPVACSGRVEYLIQDCKGDHRVCVAEGIRAAVLRQVLRVKCSNCGKPAAECIREPRLI